MAVKNVVIIGGVAGGATAAARLRRLDENVKITVLEKGDYISFANCGLPYYIGGIIKEKKALELMTDELFNKRFNVDVRLNNEALEINRKEKKIKVINKKNKEEYFLNYDNLVLSPGACPLIPEFKGIDEVDIMTLRTIPDSLRIKEIIEKKKVKKAVIIGGGFIGLEMAENLHNLGIKVTIIEMLEQVMSQFDREMAQFINQELLLNGIELALGDGVENFKKIGNNQYVVTKSGNKIEADLFILAIGIKPDTLIAEKCGLKVNQKGFIIVNENMQTSDTSIYAVGDAVQIKNYITGNDTWIPLAGPANKQGRIASENISGRKTRYKGVLGTSVVKIFSLTAACTGLNEKSLVNIKNYNFEKIYIHPHQHAGYYPGSVPLSIKLLFEKKDGKILGAQVIGKEGADKRIDIISSLIYKNGTVYDLEELELSYAPPFSSAKDPINMAGFVASNVLRNDMPIVHWSEIDGLREKGAFILDVRTQIEFSNSHISGAVNIPDTELRQRINEVPKDKPVIVYCQVGFRGYLALRLLLQKGYKNVKNLTGGYKLYNMAIMPYQKLKDTFFVPFKSFKQEEEIGRPVDDTIHHTVSSERIFIDCTGLACPGPIVKVSEAVNKLSIGAEVEINATDPGFIADLPSWCKATGNELISLNQDGKIIKAVVKKQPKTASSVSFSNALPNDKAIILFSGELDKAIAAFIIANGARAMGRHVTIFATFWGLNVLKKQKRPKKLKKNMIEKMFQAMLPKNASKLPLSNMNMMGMGPLMIKGIMKVHNVDSLEVMIKRAIEGGVRVVACQMTMDLMGIKKEELLDGVEIAGVASFLEAGENSDTSLFIS